MEVFLRDATEQDKDLLFQWANEEQVRKQSFTPGKITYEEHCVWFDEMMQNEQIIQWILTVDKQPVGQIRLKLRGENAEVGYSICAERRREGFGKLILSLATQRVKNEFPKVKRMTAKVKTDNVASLKAFEKNGYRSLYEYLELELPNCRSLEKADGGIGK